MLTTKFVHDPSLAKAAEELITNALRLIVSGRFEHARELLLKLVTPGPWKLAKHGKIAQPLERWLPLACSLCHASCPEIGGTAARTSEEIAEWSDSQMLRLLGSMISPVRKQIRPAGENWTFPMLHALALEQDIDKRRKTFGTFCMDAEFILKTRMYRVFLGYMAESGVTNDMESPDGNQYEPPDVNIFVAQIAPLGITEAAEGITTADIGQALLDFQRNSAAPYNYSVSSNVLLAMTIGLAEKEYDRVLEMARFMVGDAMSLDQLAAIVPHDPFRDFLKSGICAESVGVTDASVDTLFQAVNSRTASAPKETLQSAYFSDSLQEFTKSLVGTRLEGREIIELPILDTPEKAYAIETSVADMEKDWHCARALVAQTQRWPIVTTSWDNRKATLRETLLNDSIFSRFYYKEAPNVNDISPRALISAADSVNVADFLRKKVEQHEAHDNYENYKQYTIDATLQQYGCAPTEQELAEAKILGQPLTTLYQLDWWLLDWELRQGLHGDPKLGQASWFDPEPAVLLFLPSTNSWDALAYLNWYGTSDFGSEYYMALGRSWQARYGAELFAHFGTKLECFVDRPPNDLDDAWSLAREHDLTGSSTLGGTPVRQYALGLINHDRWFLHERP